MTAPDHFQVLPRSHYTSFQIPAGLVLENRGSSSFCKDSTNKDDQLTRPLSTREDTPYLWQQHWWGAKRQLIWRFLSTPHWEIFLMESSVVPFIYLLYMAPTTFQPWCARSYWISTIAMSMHKENLRDSLPTTQKPSPSAAWHHPEEPKV